MPLGQQNARAFAVPSSPAPVRRNNFGGAHRRITPNTQPKHKLTRAQTVGTDRRGAEGRGVQDKRRAHPGLASRPPPTPPRRLRRKFQRLSRERALQASANVARSRDACLGGVSTHKRQHYGSSRLVSADRLKRKGKAARRTHRAVAGFG